MRTDKRKNLKRPNVRSLKIYSDIRFNERSKTDIARILLSGKWLMDLGFKPYERVSVFTMPKLLIIRLDE